MTNNHWLYEDLAQSDLYNPLDDNHTDADVPPEPDDYQSPSAH